MSIVCGTHFLLALFLLCPMWYSGMSRLILVLIFFFSFLQCPDVCPEVYCSLLCLRICSSPLLFETGVSAELHQLTVSSSWLPVNSLLFTRGTWLQPVCLHASFSTRDFYRWGHIPSSFLVLFMWSSYFHLSFQFKGFSLVFDGGQICKW